MTLLAGKRVLITGALGTLGRALVQRYAEEGAAVIASDRPYQGEGAAAIGGIAPAASYFGVDLNDLEGLESAATSLLRDVGGIDILVNNAAYVVNKPHDQFSIAEYEAEVRINSSASFVLARVCGAHMKTRQTGKIVFVTSATLSGHWEGFVPYIASKGAMLGLVKGLSRELGHHGINVNGVSPGAIVSEAEWRHFGDKREAYHQWVLERQCLKRRIEPMDVANLAVFLSSPQSDLITGQNIACDGGW